MDRFAQILFDLGQEVGVELFPDENRICQLNVEDTLTLQIHFQEEKEQLILATFVSEVPAGKYRETLFQFSLIHNHQIERMGTLGYLERSNQLTLFHPVAATELKTEDLVTTLQEFIKTAKEWKEAIERGNTLPVEETTQPEDSMFGTK